MKSNWRRLGVAVLAVACLSLLPANAGGKGRTKSSDGGINPSNTATVDGDYTTMSMSSPDSMGAGHASPEEQIQAAAAHETATGRGVVVAVLDGGFNCNHPDIAANLSPFGYDAIDLDGDPHDVGNGVDDNRDGVVDGGVGHGTFVSGMILKAAPDATIVPIRVRDDEGYGDNRELIRGIEYAVALGVDVINLSVDGADYKRRGINNALGDAWWAGIVVVVSAGNDGESRLNDLGWWNYTLVAGSVDRYDRVSSFSNYVESDPGYALLMFAPGEDLYGPLGTPYDDARGYWSGTSFAAGFVSGAAALLLEINPHYSLSNVYDAMKTSVDPARYHDGRLVESGGRLNLAKVVSR